MNRESWVVLHDDQQQHPNLLRRTLCCMLPVIAAVFAIQVRGQSQDDSESTPLAQPVVKPAIDGIFEAFETHPLVGLGEWHQVAQILDFYRALIRDPRFASEVGHVVVEFGGAGHQDAIDRYVDGQRVPYAELRKVWTETVGWVPAVLSEGYARFFAQVRETNLDLGPEERIQVWLGEPPIDWAEIETREDYQKIRSTRDSHAAKVIIRNILTENRKALVIYGIGHFAHTQPWERTLRGELTAVDPDGPWSGDGKTLREIVEQAYPDSFFVAQTYRGFQDEDCTRRFEQQVMADWPLPAIAVAVPGTTLERELRRCLSPLEARQISFPSTIPEDLQERLSAMILANDDPAVPLLSDGLLFHGPAADLTVATPFLELSLDEAWRAELNRRYEVMSGGESLPPEWGRGPSAPVPYEGRD